MADIELEIDRGEGMAIKHVFDTGDRNEYMGNCAALWDRAHMPVPVGMCAHCGCSVGHRSDCDRETSDA